MLVLLVIVLTTATFVAKGIIPIDLSEAKSSNKLLKNKELTISINLKSEIYFNKKRVQKDEIISSLKEFKTTTNISISCDKDAKFESFVYIIDILKDKGYKNLGIITKYE